MSQYKTFTLVPKSGRGIVTSRSPQVLAEYSDSLFFAQNLLAKDGVWLVRKGDETFPLIAAATGPVYGIHYYNAIDPANPGATPTTVYLVHSGQLTTESGTSTLYRSDTGTPVQVNGVDFTTTSPSDIFFLNIKNRCFVAGTKMGTGVVPTILTKYPSVTSYKWGVDAPTADLMYDAYTNTTNATTMVRFDAAAATCVNNSATINKAAGANWNDTGSWDGKTIMLNDVMYTIVHVVSTTQMTISPAWVDDGSSPCNMRVQYGEVSWTDLPPQYCYCYYNPATGHISNHSPIMSISETNIANVRVAISGIQLTNDPNYTHVVLFRTAFANGGDLLPLRLDAGATGTTATVNTTPGTAGYGMILNNAVGTVIYVDNLPDPRLNDILGATSDVGATAPFINNPPPADIRYMAFWDSRVWVVSASTLYRLGYSGSSGQIPLGVPEECFPAKNYLDISADDGFITGLRVVGTSLLVCTERYLYFVDGGSETTYRMQRISSRGAGVDQYAIDEHPGDTSDQSASAVFVSKDKRLWRQFPGGKVEDIGWPIQDKLDRINLNLRKPVIVKVANVGKSWFLLLGIREVLPTARYGYIFYDFDEQSWLDEGFGTPTLWGSNYSGYLNSMWSGIASGVNYQETSGNFSIDIGADGVGTQRFGVMSADVQINSAGITSQFLDFGDKQAKKTLQEIIVHSTITDPAKLLCYALFDDEARAYPLSYVADSSSPTSPRYMGTNVWRFVLKTDTDSIPSGGFVRSQFHTLKVAQVLNLIDPNTKIIKVVINYTMESTGISGSIS